jgi:transposase
MLVYCVVMPKPITIEEREKIIKHKQNNENEADIARWLFISESSVTKLWALYKKTGTTNPRPRTQGRKPLVTEQTMEQITQKIEQQPDITLKELIEEFNLQITLAALSKRLIKLGYTFKKRVSIQKNKKTPEL